MSQIHVPLFLKKHSGKNNNIYFPFAGVTSNIHSVHLVNEMEGDPGPFPYLVVRFNSESEHLRPQQTPVLKTKTVRKSDQILNSEGRAIAIKPEAVYTLIEHIPVREKDQVVYTDLAQVATLVNYLENHLVVDLPKPITQPTPEPTQVEE